jgi:hypothetical protein
MIKLLLMVAVTTQTMVTQELARYVQGKPPIHTTDTWGNKLYYHTFNHVHATTYVVGSNGMDGIYNNEDDIYATKTVFKPTYNITPPRYASPDGK